MNTTSLSNLNLAALTPRTEPTAPAALRSQGAPTFNAAKSTDSEELRAKFTQFVGETFFGQMLKAMRSTVGKPAYFHGGQAEEVFRGQLDQKLSEHLTDTTAARFAEPMFYQQFPQLRPAPAPKSEAPLASGMDQLGQLSRR